MVAALLVVCFGCYQLLSSATDLAGDVARTANDHAAAGTEAAPRVLNPTVDVKDGIAVLRLRCDTACAGIAAVTVGRRTDTSSYQVPADVTVDFPVPVPMRATHAQATFTETTGASTTVDLTLKRAT